MKITDLINSTRVFLRDRKRAYQLAFMSPAGQLVLQDLAKFCRAAESVYNTDARLTDVLIGRNEVWHRIQQHIMLNEMQLFALYNGNQMPIAALAKQEEDDNE